MLHSFFRPPLVALLSGLALLTATAATAQEAEGRRAEILKGYQEAAQKENASFTGFDRERGRQFYSMTHGDPNREVPSCQTCHGPDPKVNGQTRAGKSIEPMAVSAAPQRFVDSEKVEKWFGRNCSSVLKRDCTAQEKGDFITYLMSQ